LTTDGWTSKQLDSYMTVTRYLKADVPTRWNSTYIMLKSAIVYEKVFTKLADEDMSYVMDLSEGRGGFGHPDEIDWETQGRW
jgi:hypothetical protein